MSDYISKSALIDSILQNVVITTEEGLDLRGEIVDLIKNQPTLDETEIIRKSFERVLERLEEKQTEYEKISEQKYFDMPQACYYKGYEEGYKGAIKICKEEGGIE